MMKINPTKKPYSGLDHAYAVFNAELFGDELPSYLISIQRVKKAYGYFAGGRFGSKDGAFVTDEIALNPSHFSVRPTEQTLSTLVHEMVHLWQHHFGKPSRGGYHNREWAEKMHSVGLAPSSTGEPGGNETGQRVTHSLLSEDHSRPFMPSWRRKASTRSMSSWGRREKAGGASQEGGEQDML
ncbi:SprT-like domain-containing protein [Mesorhizobium shangrilense]|uniref:SprT-like domain-containing protein n=1 Tax=Mesorhizobium shangrilense TaxID=460060 RepID=A0ABV2DQE6_9HYPH